MIDVTQETPSPRMDPDVLALAAFHAGDRGAGLRLFERHVRPVRRYFLNKVRQDGDVDDLVHEVFQIMFNPESGFAAARSFGAYLFGVQQNVLRAYYRLRTDVAPTASVADFGASNSTWLERQERCQQLLVALRRLPIPQQEVLELHYWEDISGPRIAVLLDVPGGTVASRIRLAKQALLEGMGLRPEPAAYDEVLLALDQWAADIAGRLRGERPA
jgi:RNA polymerase sigma-70 factor (ECF subfamily)